MSGWVLNCRGSLWDGAVEGGEEISLEWSKWQIELNSPPCFFVHHHKRVTKRDEIQLAVAWGGLKGDVTYVGPSGFTFTLLEGPGENCARIKFLQLFQVEARSYENHTALWIAQFSLLWLVSVVAAARMEILLVFNGEGKDVSVLLAMKCRQRNVSHFICVWGVPAFATPKRDPWVRIELKEGMEVELVRPIWRKRFVVWHFWFDPLILWSCRNLIKSCQEYNSTWVVDRPI